MELEAYACLPEFHSRYRASSFLMGQHDSRMRGRGLDFDQLRRYERGDDIRHLDWRATRRTGTPLVRSFTEERDRPTMILCDQRMDMFFGSTYLLKATAAAEVAAVLAWIAFHAGDRVGGIAFNDQKLEMVPPHRSRQRISDLLTRIARQNQTLSTANTLRRISGQLDRVISGCVANAHHDQTVCIVSDFAGLTDRTQGLLQQLSFHNDVIAIQIYDPLAVMLPDTGVTTFSEDQVEVSLDLGHPGTRENLTAFLQERFRAVDELLKRSRVVHLKVSAGKPTASQLNEVLGLMRKHRR
jgi:uncharacterized protein (DUF58 family)